MYFYPHFVDKAGGWGSADVDKREGGAANVDIILIFFITLL